MTTETTETVDTTENPVYSATVDITQEEPIPVADSSEVEDTQASEPAASGEPQGVVCAIEHEGVKLDFPVPPEGVSILESAGLTPDEFIKGALSDNLPQDKIKSLKDKHGAFIVDSLLAGIKSEVMLNSRIQQEKSTRESQILQDMAGGWDALQDFVSTSQDVTDEEVAAFNLAMASGNLQLQQMAVSVLRGKMDKASSPSLNLIQTGNGATSAAAMTSCTREQYIAAVASGEYQKNPQMWDNARTATLNSTKR